MAKSTIELFTPGLAVRRLEAERRDVPRVILRVWDCGGVAIRREFLEGARVPPAVAMGRVAGSEGVRTVQSASRAKMAVQCLLLANTDAARYGWFWTGTFADDVEDYDSAVAAWSRFVRRLRRIYPGFSYVCVPEIQEGRAKRYGVRVWHFHAVIIGPKWPPGLEWVRGGNGRLVVDRRRSDRGGLNLLDSVRRSFSQVWNEVNGGDNRCEAQPIRSAESLSSYVRKYVTKTTLLEVPPSRKCYFSGGQLVRPVVEAYRLDDDLPPPPMVGDVTSCYSYISEYVGRITQYQYKL